MIRIERRELPSTIVKKLRDKTGKLAAAGSKPVRARSMWRGAKALQRDLRDQLQLMAMGINCCMYCGDGLSPDIDHFEPLSLAPERTFDWLNHLLACAHCNSHHKRDLFPRDQLGRPMLVDPTCEEPADHLEFILSTGDYEPLTVRGEITVETFKLNRDALRRSRLAAVHMFSSMLRDRSRAMADGNHGRVEEVTASLREQPFAGVLYAMLAYKDQPAAALVIGTDTLQALSDPTVNFWTLP
ncbi:HNH endonuclease [Nonomuraea sp. NPDC050540]|uniref:HNH endonuclease n=1 Tax=Nonomuraea sp. NPDC050540 TaxID=3364367 RepID=UPI00379A37EA